MAASLTKAVKVICHYDQLWLTIIKYHHLSTTINCHQQTSETSDLNLAYPCASEKASVWLLSAPDLGIPWKIVGFPKEPYRNAASQKSTSLPIPLLQHLMLNQRQNRRLARKIRRWKGIPWLHVTQGSGSPRHWILIVGVLSFQKGYRTTPPHPGCNRQMKGFRLWFPILKNGRCHPGSDETIASCLGGIPSR